MRSGPSRATRSDMMANSAPALDPRSVRWDEFRDDCGRRRDRWRALQLVSACTGYVPLPYQLRAHLATVESGTMHKMICAGVGSGKSYWSGVEMLILAICNPGTNGAFLGPTYDSVMHVMFPIFEELCQGMAAHGCPILRNYHKSLARADLVGGGSIFFRSFERHQNLRGMTLGYIGLDESEVSRAPEEVWSVLASRLRDPKANIVQLHATSTPRGLRGIPRLFIENRAVKARRPHWFACRAATMENVHLDDGFLDSLRASHSKRSWQVEVEAKILKPDHTVFPEWSPETHVRPWAYDPTMPYSLAIDWGYTHPYVAWIQHLPGGEFVVFHEFCEDETPIERLHIYLRDMVDKLGAPPLHAAADRAVKSENSWFISERCFQKTYFHKMETRVEQSINVGLEMMRNWIDPVEGQPRLYVSAALSKTQNPRAMINALRDYRWAMTRDGMISDQPYKCNRADHCVDALRYFVRAVERTGSDRAHPIVVQRSHNVFGRKSHRRR